MPPIATVKTITQKLWEEAVASVSPPVGLDLNIGSLILKGHINPVSLVDGTMTLIDLNYVANLVKYKETVLSAFDTLKAREIEKRKAASGGPHGNRRK